jgi:hypothetical protein
MPQQPASFPGSGGASLPLAAYAGFTPEPFASRNGLGGVPRSGARTAGSNRSLVVISRGSAAEMSGDGMLMGAALCSPQSLRPAHSIGWLRARVSSEPAESASPPQTPVPSEFLGRTGAPRLRPPKNRLGRGVQSRSSLETERRPQRKRSTSRWTGPLRTPRRAQRRPRPSLWPRRSRGAAPPPARPPHVPERHGKLATRPTSQSRCAGFRTW